MTGKASGKLGLDGASVYLASKKERIKLKNPVIYIHLKGFARARVTHLDVEHDILDNIIPPKRGRFLSIHGIENGLEIKLDEEKEIDLESNELMVEKIEIIHPLLNEILNKNEKTRTWVGGKFGGIYIGFKKKEIKKLEELAEKEFGMKPL